MADKNAWTDPANEHEEAIRYLVENTDVSPLQAKELVERHGTDQEVLIEIAKTRKVEG